MTQPDPTAVRRARHEGAIEAFRSAAERMSLGAAVGSVPLEARPAVETWLRRLAEQRLDRARKEAAAPVVQSPADQAALRERIAAVATPFFANFSDEEAAKDNAGELADAVLAVLPEQPARDEAVADTLPAWLHQRFDPRGADWEQLDDDDRAYWEHHARAVRRAVTRNGFKEA